MVLEKMQKNHESWDKKITPTFHGKLGQGLHLEKQRFCLGKMETGNLQDGNFLRRFPLLIFFNHSIWICFFYFICVYFIWVRLKRYSSKVILFEFEESPRGFQQFPLKVMFLQQ